MDKSKAGQNFLMIYCFPKDVDLNYKEKLYKILKKNFWLFSVYIGFYHIYF